MSLAAAAPLPPLALERPADAAEVEALLGVGFGPGRYAKAAERVREGREPDYALSFVAREAGRIVGCVRQWRVKVGDTPAIFLGPFAVDPAFRSQGLGAALIGHACAAAAAAGHELIVLVGDLPYFSPLGFAVAHGVTMPGPVDPGRVLMRALKPGVTGPRGLVAPA